MGTNEGQFNQVALKDEISKKALLWGAEFFGVADLEGVRSNIREMYGDGVGIFPRGVSLGISIPAGAVEQLKKGSGPGYTADYAFYYDHLNRKLDAVADKVAKMLIKRGFEAMPVPVSRQEPGKQYRGAFSHRLAAAGAGLGWIGRSCSLVNPEVGPALRLVTVLTGAPLPAGQPLAAACGDCRACVKACPPGALTGIPFDRDDPLSRRFDPRLCDGYLKKLEKRYGRGICGKCIAACPVGKGKRG